LRDLLDFMDQATVLELIQDVEKENLMNENPLKALQMLEAIEGHQKFMSDPLVLSTLNPIKQRCKNGLGRDILANRKRLGEVLETEVCEIKLRAYSSYNASAVLETASGLHLIESPYAEDQARPVTEQQLDYLVNRLEFSATDKAFEKFQDLVSFVREKAEAARAYYKTSELTEEEMIAGFELYPEEILHSLLDDLRQRYFDAGKYEETRMALGRYWKVRAMREDELLLQKLVALRIDLSDILNPLTEIKAKPSNGALPLTYEKHGHRMSDHVSGFASLVA
jgi:hypothetical protein